MKLKKSYDRHGLYCNDTEDLVRNLVSLDVPWEVAGLIARMLDAMPLTDQQKLDIIAPYSGWEIVKEEE